MDLAGQVTPKTLAHFDFLGGVQLNRRSDIAVLVMKVGAQRLNREA
jgi:hypothetical protein